MRTVEGAAPGRQKKVVDTRRSTRRLAAMVIPIGPLAVAFLRLILPYRTVDEPAAMFTQVSANPGTQSTVLWLAFAAVLTLVPAVIWVGRLIRRRVPRLTAAALLLLVPGYLALAWMISVDLLLYSGAKAGVGAPTMTALLAAVHPASNVAAGVFVLGHVIGTVVLGVGMLRSKVVPGWAGIATIVSQPLHFVAAVIVGSPGLDFFAWGLNAAGFTAAAVAILRLPDDQWDLPVVGSGKPPTF